MRNKLLATLTLSLASLVTACGGGGGGGGGEQQPAQLSLSVSPTEIDTGDRITAEVEIDSITSGSIALKVRIPTGLRYVAASSKLRIGEGFINYEPTTVAAASDYRYIVYYLGVATLEPEDHGTLKFVLSGASGVEDGEVEVDADVDDPAVANSKEFNVSDPKFDPQDAVSISVRGAAVGTPTPTPKPSS
jgi:hypothetical protein